MRRLRVRLAVRPVARMNSSEASIDSAFARHVAALRNVGDQAVHEAIRE